MSTPVGPLSSAELEAATRSRLPSGVNTLADQFPRNLVLWAKDWLRANESRLSDDNATKPFVIIYSSAPLLDAQEWVAVNQSKEGIKRYHYTSYDVPSHGLLFATANLHEAYTVGPKYSDGSTVLDDVLEPPFHSRQYAIFFPDQRSVALHVPGDTTAGFADIQSRQTLGGYSIYDLSLKMLDDLLAAFHTKVVETRSCWGGAALWTEPYEDRRLVKEAEKVIQGFLATFFYGNFDSKGVHTDWEVYTGAGRADIRLLRLSQEKKRTTAYIELKVVRYDDSENKMLDWVHSGIEQAYGYKFSEVPPAEFGMTCCYNNHDKGDTIQAAAQPLADQKGITLRFYPIRHTLRDEPIPPTVRKYRSRIAK